MQKHRLEPRKDKKNLKTATQEYITQKIDEQRRIKKNPVQVMVPKFLKKKKEAFINQLISLG